MSAAGGQGAEIGQKNQVEIFIGTLSKVLRSSSLYTHGAGQNMLEQLHDNVAGALEKAFGEEDEFEVSIQPTQIIFNRKVIYEDTNRKKSLAVLLFENGVRVLQFKKGMTREELVKLLQVIGADLDRADMMDEDLYCLLTEEQFEHLNVLGTDIVADAKQKNPKIKEELKDFEKVVSQKFFEAQREAPRKLRADDLKVLEEFNLSAAQFKKSDEEVSKIVKSVLHTQSGPNKEKETLERLALMGFHFLIQGDDLEQAQVGRDLITQVGFMMLDRANVGLFKILLRKIYQLQADQKEQVGEYQKILDQIFHIDYLPTFSKLLSNADTSKETCEVLLNGPSNAIRLQILLLSQFPWAPRVFGKQILEGLPDHMSWLVSRVEEQPDEPAWEQLLNIMSTRPNQHFDRFLTTLFEHAGEVVKSKLLRQCAQIGTDESLKVFRKYFQSEESEDRKLAFERIAGAKNKKALMMVKSQVDLEEFESRPEEERRAGYSCVISIGGKSSMAWVESLWMKEGQGLFKKKKQNERREDLLVALLRSYPQGIESVLRHTPLESLPEDLQSLVKKAHLKSHE